jgi:hypothetical protein
MPNREAVMPELTLESMAALPPAPPFSTADAVVMARAEFFVRMVQGTMALEGQAVDAAAERRLVEQATEQLLADRGE